MTHKSIVISKYPKVAKCSVIMLNIIINTDGVVGEFDIINTVSIIGEGAYLSYGVVIYSNETVNAG